MKKPKTLETKVSTEAETEGYCSSFANEYEAKTRTHKIQDCADELDYPLLQSHPKHLNELYDVWAHVINFFGINNDESMFMIQSNHTFL